MGYWHGPLARHVTLQIAHAPVKPGTFSPPPRVSDHDMHHGTCVTHVPLCMAGSLTSGFLWSRWWEKRSQLYRRMRSPQFYVSEAYDVRGLWQISSRWMPHLRKAISTYWDRHKIGRWTEAMPLFKPMIILFSANIYHSALMSPIQWADRLKPFSMEWNVIIS